MTSYRVNILNGTSYVGTFTVDATDKEAAKTEAVQAAVTFAKSYNANYHASFAANGVEWALRSENAADYAATTVRKAPVKRVVA